MNKATKGLLLIAALSFGAMFLAGCFGVIAMEGEHGRVVAGAHVPGMTVVGAGGHGGLVVIKARPPAPKREKKPKRPKKGHVWVAGHWTHTGNHYTWKKGYWVRKKANATWIAARWAQRGGGWVYIQGKWSN
ncbi:hypothetical protein ACFL4W_02890 [Planctomycetota bacterium]